MRAKKQGSQATKVRYHNSIATKIFILVCFPVVILTTFLLYGIWSSNQRLNITIEQESITQNRSVKSSQAREELHNAMARTISVLGALQEMHLTSLLMEDKRMARKTRELRGRLSFAIDLLTKRIDKMIVTIEELEKSDISLDSNIKKSIAYIKRSGVVLTRLMELFLKNNSRTIKLIGENNIIDARSNFYFEEKSYLEAITARINRTRVLIEVVTKGILTAESEHIQEQYNKVKTASGFEAKLALLIASITAFLILGATIYLSTALVSNPIKHMVGLMHRLSDGDIKIKIPKITKDEIGEFANALKIFRDSIIEKNQLHLEQEKIKIKSEKERKEILTTMADDLTSHIGMVMVEISSSADQLEANANNLKIGAQEASQNTSIASDASQKATQNVEKVSNEVDNLAKSSMEISKKMNEVSQVTQEAGVFALSSNRQFESLSEIARDIGEVIELIQEIAGQTNMLALNATIEAVRAGKYGKGFVVVANEVKMLARPTAEATDNITSKVKSIQDATDKSVDAVSHILDTIHHIKDISSSISKSIKDQQLATEEIAHSAKYAADGTKEVSERIEEVSNIAIRTNKSALDVLHSAGELNEQSTHLREAMDDFIARVSKAA